MSPDKGAGQEESQPEAGAVRGGGSLLGEGRVVIAMILSQEDPTQPVVIDFTTEVYDVNGVEVGHAKPIRAEQENLLGALDSGGDYLKMMAKRLSYALVEQAQRDPNLAKHLGLEGKQDAPGQ